MKKFLASATCVLSLFSSQASLANIDVNFIESAPKDSFIIKNTSECALDNIVVTIDLSKSAGKLIFDTTDSGAGVEVFQPFEIKEGDIKLVSLTDPKDGDDQLSIRINNLASQAQASFTIDVDDTLPRSELGEIRVTGSEIKGATVTVKQESKATNSAVFGGNSKAIVAMPSC